MRLKKQNQKILLKLKQEDKRNNWSSEKSVVVLLSALLRLYSARTFLEIGTYLGQTSLSLVFAHKILKVTTIDLNASLSPTLSKLSYSEKKRVSFIEGDSIKIMKKLIKKKQRYDIIFIDGDHAFTKVTFDFMLSIFLVNKPGCIVLHDAKNNHDTGVKTLCIILKFFSMLTFNQLYTIVILPTPQYPHRPISGVALVTFN